MVGDRMRGDVNAIKVPHELVDALVAAAGYGISDVTQIVIEPGRISFSVLNRDEGGRVRLSHGDVLESRFVHLISGYGS
jgi:hypothetical protein